MCFDLERIRSLDFLAPPISLNVNGKTSFKTFTGVFCTMLYFGIMLTVIILSLMNYFSSTNPNNQGLSYTQANYPTVDLKRNKLIPVFVAYSDETTFIQTSDLSAYFTLRIQKVTWETSVLQDGTPSTIKKITYVSLIPCSQLSPAQLQTFDFVGEGSYYYKAMLSYGICPNLTNTDYSVTGKGSDPLFQTITFQLYPCSLPDGIGCATPGSLSMVNFQLLSSSANFNASNLNNPLSFILNADDVYYINTYINQKIVSKVREVAISDLRGVYPTKFEKRLEYFDIDSVTLSSGSRNQTCVKCTAAQIDSLDPQCSPYYEFTVQSGATIVENKRAYQTLSSTIGLIGGISTVFILTFGALYKYINKFKLEEYMVRKTFSLFVQEDITENSPKSEGILQRWCCCCRKKTPEELEEIRKSKSKAQDCLNMIYDSLDIRRIAKNTVLIFVLSKLLFNKEHMTLAQVLGMKHWIREVERHRSYLKKVDRAANQNKWNSFKKMNEKDNFEIIVDKQTYNNAIDNLKKLDASSEGREKEFQLYFEGMINQHFIANLKSEGDWEHIRPIQVPIPIGMSAVQVSAITPKPVKLTRPPLDENILNRNSSIDYRNPFRIEAIPIPPLLDVQQENHVQPEPEDKVVMATARGTDVPKTILEMKLGFTKPLVRKSDFLYQE